MRRLRYALFAILEWFFPRFCILCGCELGREETHLCRKCRANTREYPFGFSKPAPDRKRRLQFLDSFTAVWYYEGNVRDAILRYKFGRQVYLCRILGPMMGMKLMSMGPYEFDCLTWVPISALRRFRRGYDQSEFLAEYVGRSLGVEPVRLLKKKRNTPAQSSLRDASSRKANVFGAYALHGDYDLTGTRILLVDDVLTTGATAEECARMLKSAGAAQVHCVSVAAAHSHK